MNSIPDPLRTAWRIGRDLLRVSRGYAQYLRHGRSPEDAFHGMRRLYCLTDGRFNDAVARLQGWARPPRLVPNPAGVLGPTTTSEVRTAVRSIERDGYYVFPRLLRGELCDRLIAFAKRTPMRIVDERSKHADELRVYDEHSPVGVKYDCDRQTLMEEPASQEVVTDPGILAVAQAYLQAEPVQDLVALWWSTAITRQASSAAAQLYHFDMDRIKFLKFFFYLTDVGSDNGPHCYIRRSHLRKPRALLRLDRISDQEILAHYPPSHVVEITGPRGSIAAVDTRGFHKGKPLVDGHRLMFQIEFATDLFGYDYPKIQVNEHFTPDFLGAMRARPYTYSSYASRKQAEEQPHAGRPEPPSH